MVEIPNERIGESYEIKLKGHLDESWAIWFEDLAFVHENDGTTTLKSENMDQSALHGLLKKIRDLGLPLISVNQLDVSQSGMPDANLLTDKSAR